MNLRLRFRSLLTCCQVGFCSTGGGGAAANDVLRMVKSPPLPGGDATDLTGSAGITEEGIRRVRQVRPRRSGLGPLKGLCVG